MNIYLLSRIGHTSYDEYDSFVIFHNSEEEAKKCHPSGEAYEYPEWVGDYCGSWVDALDKIKVELIGSGQCDKAGKIIISSFNAG